MSFRIPEGDWTEQDRNWSNLHSRLFSFLQAALRQAIVVDPEKLVAELLTWRAFTESSADERRRKRQELDNDLRLVACFKFCRSQDAADVRNEIDYLCRVLGETDECLKGHEGWALDCVSLLKTNRPRTAVRSVRVFAAFSDEILQDAGTVAALEVEHLEPGGGQVFQKPSFPLFVCPTSAFHDSMGKAWKAAVVLARTEGVEKLCDGRWDLVFPEPQPSQEVDGCSASGASARAWSYCLENKIPDDGIIVLAEANEVGLLTGVGGVEAKVKAIAEDGRFDTITVVEENYIEAKRTLEETRKNVQIRVVDIANYQSPVSQNK